MLQRRPHLCPCLCFLGDLNPECFSPLQPKLARPTGQFHTQPFSGSDPSISRIQALTFCPLLHFHSLLLNTSSHGIFILRPRSLLYPATKSGADSCVRSVLITLPGQFLCPREMFLDHCSNSIPDFVQLCLAPCPPLPLVSTILSSPVSPIHPNPTGNQLQFHPPSWAVESAGVDTVPLFLKQSKWRLKR